MSKPNRLLLPVLATLLMAPACEPLVTTFEDIEGVEYYRAADIQSADDADSLDNCPLAEQWANGAFLVKCNMHEEERIHCQDQKGEAILHE